MRKLLALPVAAALGLGTVVASTHEADAYYYRRGNNAGALIAAGILGGVAAGALAAPTYGYYRRPAYYGYYPARRYYSGPVYYTRPVVYRRYYTRPVYYGPRYYHRPYYGW